MMKSRPPCSLFFWVSRSALCFAVAACGTADSDSGGGLDAGAPDGDATADTGSNGPPTCTIELSPDTVLHQTQVKVSWKSTNAMEGMLNHGIGTVGPSGSVTVAASLSNTVFAGRFSGPGGVVVCSARAVPAMTGAPTVTGVYPNPASPGSIVVVTGTDFAPLNEIKLGSTVISKTAVGAHGGRTLSFTVPKNQTLGDYSLVVRSPFGDTSSKTIHVVSKPAQLPLPTLGQLKFSLSISPNPCTVPKGQGLCQVQASWTGNPKVSPTSQLWASKDGKTPALVHCSASSSKAAVPWIQVGHTYEFFLYAANSCVEAGRIEPPLARVTTTGIPEGALHFPPSNVGMTFLNGPAMYLGRHGGGDGTEPFAVVERALARKALSDLRMTGSRFIRTGASGWSPQDLALWLADEDAYWAVYDSFIADLESRGLAAVPILAWHIFQFPALVNEGTADLITNPDSKSYQLLKKYVTQLIGRYKKSSALYFYELGGEYGNRANVDLKGSTYCTKLPTPSWFCNASTNFTTNQLVSFFTRLASYIRILDPSRPIDNGDTLTRDSAEHLRLQPGWAGLGPDWTKDSLEEYAKYFRYVSQGLDIMSIHFYNMVKNGSTYSHRLGIGGDKNTADLLDIVNQVVTASGKKLYIGESGDWQPFYIEDRRGLFQQNILEKTKKLGIPYSSPWIWEIYSKVSPSETRTGLIISDKNNIEPGRTPELIKKIKQVNDAFGTSLTPPTAPAQIVITAPFDGATLSKFEDVYAVASAPMGGSVARVDVSMDGVPVGSTTVLPKDSSYRVEPKISPLSPGVHVIEATAVTTGGHSATDAIAITIK